MPCGHPIWRRKTLGNQQESRGGRQIWKPSRAPPQIRRRRKKAAGSAPNRTKKEKPNEPPPRSTGESHGSPDQKKQTVQETKLYKTTNKQKNKRGHRKGTHKPTDPEGSSEDGAQAGSSMLERPGSPQRLKHQNVGSSKASDQKNHRAGKGRQMQERRERKGERRKRKFLLKSLLSPRLEFSECDINIGQ
ncbi:hypothetical protein SLEP1_g56564 [Rubroshorea leprosula]|uniref:Uncharacterized protein n=1 Tax=Rubroshorea leprosula TaxID=152421 RepID=A0AAV5MML0_9ROSI|nr:hypothetical protein SLEP1_g56564 [Rubroshorea leprosula]